MLKIPISMLLSLVIFVIVAGALLLILGSPKCDSMANTTAYYLKNAIDEVSKDNFYSWDKGGIPPDNEISYYRTAPITLCQDKGISYLETILGTTLEPQYKIYYETFPESGGGVWTEAYPWSGGAASTLRMWAYMRIAYGAFKISNALLMKVSAYANFMKKVYGVGQRVKDWFSKTDLDKILEDPKIKNYLTEELGMLPEEINSADWLIDAGKTSEAYMTMDDAMESGILTKDQVEETTNRLIISKDPIKVEIPVEVYENGQLTTYYADVFALKDGSGNIIDMTTDINKVYIDPKDFSKGFNTGWDQFKVKPTDVYRDWLETFPPSQRAVFEDIYVPADEVGIVTTLKNKVRETNFYKKFYQPTEEKIKKFIAKIKYLGYRVDITHMPTQEVNGLQLAFIDAIDKDPDVAEAFLRQDGIRDKLARALGKSADEIQASHLKEFIMDFKLNGIIFLPDGTDLEVYSSSIKTIIDAVKNSEMDIVADEAEVFYNSLGGQLVPINPALPLTPDNIAGVIPSSDPQLLKKYEIIKDMSKTLKISEDDAAIRSYGFIYNHVFPEYQNEFAIGTLKTVSMTANSASPYIQELIQKYKAGDEKAAVQLASLLGLIEQNKGTLSVNIKTPAGMTADYFKSQAKKMIYLDGPQNILNPASFYARVLFADYSRVGCEGNSICVYSHAAMMEAPFYLNETAKKYFVRVWRPVEGWKQWAGWQAALQHIPPNPRFYVVSPCFATAKIWKTKYNGDPTIFVYPEKVDLGDSASNYCYADEGLINQYTAVWLGSDAATIITTITGFGVASDAVKLIGKIINIADPVTLAQGIIEGAISWPTWPYKALTYQQIIANSGKVGLKEIKKGEETQK